LSTREQLPGGRLFSLNDIGKLIQIAAPQCDTWNFDSPGASAGSMVDDPLHERDLLPVAWVRGVANYERVALGALRGNCRKTTARSHIYSAKSPI